MSVVANIALNLDARGVPQKLREVQQGAQATEKAFNALNSAAAAFGAGFALTRVIADVRQLDTNLRRLGTVGGDVKALDKGLGALSDRLGGIANKADLAAASYQALSAGFSDTAGNLKLVEAASKAAIGGMADTTQVVEVLTKTLNAYGMSGDQAIKVTDSISKAIEYGQVEWSDYTSQLGRVASIAAIAGVSLDEVNAFIAAATKNGATAEIAFTGLGAAINTLLQPTKESTEAAAALGIQWNIGGLQAKGFGGLLADLAKKQDTNKEAVARLLGSQEAMRGVFAANAKAGSDYAMILQGLGGAAGKTDADFQTMRGSLDNILKALDTSFKNLSEAIGRAFGPTVVIIVQDLTKAINGFASVMNAVPQPVMNTLGQIVKLIAEMLLLQKAVQTIIALRAGFVGAMVAMGGATAATGVAAKTSSSAFALYASNTKTLETASAAAASKAGGLLGVLRGLAAIGVITVGINLIVTGLQEAMAAAAETRRLRGERAAGGAAAIYGGSATAQQKQTAAKTLQQVRQEQQRYQQPGVVAAQTLLGPASQLFGIPTTAQAGARRTVLGERALRAQATMGLPTRVEKQQTTPTPVPSAPYGDGEKPDAKGAKEKARLNERIRGIKIETEAAKQLSFIRDSIAQAEMDGDAQLAIRLKGEERNQQILTDYQKSLVGVTDEKEKQAVFAQAMADLDASNLATARELQKNEADKTKTIQAVMDGLTRETEAVKAVTEEQKQRLRLSEIENQLKEQGIILTDAQRAAIQRLLADHGKVVAAQTYEQQQAQQLNDLYQGLAGTVANSFGQAFDAAIKGSEDFGKAMQNLAVDIMQTVAKMLVMYAIGAALKALAGGKADDKGGILTFLAGAFGQKADGGSVKAATPYLVGERGPELFVPGTSGGVMSNSDLRASMGAAGGSAGAPVLNMSFETTSIGGVEYVSRDQLEAAMAETRRQAARDGAKRGMSMTLDRLQQSPQTRNRIGIR